MGTRAEASPVFEATKISREIFLFQMMVVDVVIGNVMDTLADMEKTNCKLPARLEKLQTLWRERKAAPRTGKLSLSSRALPGQTLHRRMRGFRTPWREPTPRDRSTVV